MATLYEFVNTTHADGSVSASLQPAAHTYYQNKNQLPSATNNHGKLAHVHSEGAMYFAHNDGWQKLVSENVSETTMAGTLTVDGALTVDAPVTVKSVLNASSGTLKINDQTEISGRLEVDGPMKCDNVTVATYPRPSERSLIRSRIDGLNFYFLTNVNECVRLMYSGQNWIVTSAYNQSTQNITGEDVFVTRLQGTDLETVVINTPLTLTLSMTLSGFYWYSHYYWYWAQYHSSSYFRTYYYTPYSIKQDHWFYVLDKDGTPLTADEITTNSDSDLAIHDFTITQDLLDNPGYYVENYSWLADVYSQFLPSISLGLNNLGLGDNPTLSFTLTDGALATLSFQVETDVTDARILGIGSGSYLWPYEIQIKIEEYLSSGGVAIVPGYQGISSSGEITTIGRGGSDATAVVIAKIFDTDSCEIYTDVDGVYSTDPNKIPVAKKIDKISYEEMLELSSLGAKVMQSSAVQTAMIYEIPLQVRSTFTNRQGTKIFNKENLNYSKAVTGVAYSKDDAKITLQDVEDKPGVAAEVFEPLGKNQINIDMVIQNVSSDGKTTDITFTVKRDDLEKSLEILKKNNKIKYKNLSYKNNVSKISIVGAGMVTTPGVTHKMFRALADEKINILAISTSEIKISVIIDENLTVKAAKKLHSIFYLD